MTSRAWETRDATSTQNCMDRSLDLGGPQFGKPEAPFLHRIAFDRSMGFGVPELGGSELVPLKIASTKASI